MLREEDLGVRPMQAELFRIGQGGLTVVRRLDRGSASLIVLNPLAGRVLLRFSTRAPSASTAVSSGDYDQAVLPGAVAVFPIERYKWVAASVDYAGAVAAQDTQLQAIGLESIVAYQPSSPGPMYGVTPAGLFVPLAVDVGGRLATNPAATGTDVGASSTGAAAILTETIAAVAGLTNWLTGFEVTGGGATGALAIDATITGLLEGTLHYGISVPAGAGLSITPLLVEFVRPRPASAVNIAIVLTVPSFGAGNTIASAAIHGYRL